MIGPNAPNPSPPGINRRSLNPIILFDIEGIGIEGGRWTEGEGEEINDGEKDGEENNTVVWSDKHHSLSRIVIDLENTEEIGRGDEEGEEGWGWVGV